MYSQAELPEHELAGYELPGHTPNKKDIAETKGHAAEEAEGLALREDPVFHTEDEAPAGASTQVELPDSAEGTEAPPRELLPLALARKE